MLNVLSFPDSRRQIAVKNKAAIKFKRYRLFRIIVTYLPFENDLFTFSIIDLKKKKRVERHT